MFGIVEVDGPCAELDEGSGADKPRTPVDPVFYLLPENERVWELWLRVQTQWRVDAEGYITGLDYAGVLARLGRTSQRRRERLFDDMHAMELVTLEESALRRARRRQEQAARAQR